MNTFKLSEHGRVSLDLKPCPFCGGVESLYPSYHWPGSGKPFAIDCIGCGIEFVPREGMDVIAAWNRRHEDQPSESDRLSKAENNHV